MYGLDWKPDRRSQLPLYLQIKAYMKGKIESGEWNVGSKIPPQRKLAEAFEVNRSTVVAALEELKAEGLLEGRQGGGTRVSNNTWSLLTSTPPPDWNSYVSSGLHKPNLPAIREINRAEYDPHIIRLGTGELSPELYPKEWMGEVFSRLADRISSLGYEEPKGLLYLRKQVSLYLRKFGIEASPSSILIVSGALQALQLISVGLLQRGSAVFLEKPSYLHSLNLFPSLGMKLHGIPLRSDGIDLRALSESIKRLNGALLYTIPTFHNPTGTLMSEEKRKQLLRLCEKERLPVIEDDVYRELWLDEPPPPPLKARDRHGMVLYLGSLSKTLSPGLRIGWIVGPETVIDRLADIKMQTDYGSSSLSQWVAAEWLESGLYERHLERIREELRRRRKIAMEALVRHFSGLAAWNCPKGGFYVWLRIPPAISIRQLFEKALEAGILVNPGNVYDPGGTQHLRISYAYASAADLERGLFFLSKIVKQLCQKSFGLR